jgi:hypothetical protein
MAHATDAHDSHGAHAAHDSHGAHHSAADAADGPTSGPGGWPVALLLGVAFTAVLLWALLA